MNDRVCLITGASRGIGLATALRFARNGYRILGVARNAAELRQAAEKIAAAGGTCEAVVADVSTPEGARDAVESAARRFGRIDVLINNAGSAPLAKIDGMSIDEFQNTIAVNVNAVYYTTRAVWPVMSRQRGGTIVNISSLASTDPFPGFAVYGACKAWVNAFTKASADEGRALGIRVIAVAPGAVETQMLRQHFADFPKEQALAPDDVAAAVESVCDDRLQFATGQTVFIRR